MPPSNETQNGWLGVVVSPGQPLGITECSKRQAAILNCQLYDTSDHCNASTQIVNYSKHATPDDIAAIVERVNLHGATVVLDAHDGAALHMLNRVVRHVITHSWRQYDAFVKYYDHVMVAPLIAQPLVKTTSVAIPRPLGTKYIIGWWGTWRPYKGIRRLIRATRIMRDNDLDVGLLVAGHAPDSKYVYDAMKYAHGIGVLKYCCLDASTKRIDEAMAVMKMADLICLPYHRDGHDRPKSIEQLLSIGKPILVSPYKGFDDIRRYCFTTDGSADDFAKWSRIFLIDAKLYDDYRRLSDEYVASHSPAVYKQRVLSFLDEA